MISAVPGSCGDPDRARLIAQRRVRQFLEEYSDSCRLAMIDASRASRESTDLRSGSLYRNQVPFSMSAFGAKIFTFADRIPFQLNETIAKQISSWELFTGVIRVEQKHLAENGKIEGYGL